MLRLLKWLAYRDRALDHLGALLVMYPRGRQFSADYPGLPAMIRSNFEDGTSPAGAALAASIEIVGGLVGQLGPEERAAVLDRLRGADPEAIRSALARQISRRPDRPGDRIAMMADLIGAAVLMARGMSEENALGRDEVAIFVRRVAGMLRPAAAEEVGRAEALRCLDERFGPSAQTISRAYSP